MKCNDMNVTLHAPTLQPAVCLSFCAFVKCVTQKLQWGGVVIWIEEMQKGEGRMRNRNSREKKKKKKTETTVLWTPVPFAHRLERRTQTAAGAIKKDFFPYLLHPIPLVFLLFCLRNAKLRVYHRSNILSSYLQLYWPTRCTVCSHRFFWSYIIHSWAVSGCNSTWLYALLALGRRTDATTTEYNNTLPLMHFTIANHNCSDTVSSLYLAVIYA